MDSIPLRFKGKPYFSAVNYIKAKYGERLQKLSIDAGLNCPNRDGTNGWGGCIYCDNTAFNPSYCNANKTITAQLDDGIIFHRKRYRRVQKYLAYFQTYTNTYGDASAIIRLYHEALQHPNVFGIVISTRPDSLQEEILDYLASKRHEKHVFFEIGVETCNNQTLSLINRGHSFEDSVKAINLLNKYGFEVGIHLIFGLPDETLEQMLAEAAIISTLPINSLKCHQLQIIKGTPMEKLFNAEPNRFINFSLEQYVVFIADFLSHLRPDIAIERLTAEVPPRFLVKPAFGMLRTDQLIEIIENYMHKHDIWQGKYYQSMGKVN